MLNHNMGDNLDVVQCVVSVSDKNMPRLNTVCGNRIGWIVAALLITILVLSCGRSLSL